MSSSPTSTLYGIIIENFKAEGPFEIDVKKGDLIQVISHPNPKWTYISRLNDFHQGYIPTLYYCSIEAKFLINYLINQISSPKGSAKSNFSFSLTSSSSSSSSTSSSCSSLFHEKSAAILSDDSNSSISSIETNNNTTPVKKRPPIAPLPRYKYSRTDPDGGSSLEFSIRKDDFNIYRNIPKSIKIYENIEPNDYEINILHLCNPASPEDLSSSSSLQSFSSRYEITFPDDFVEIPRRLFIDTGGRHRVGSQDMKDSFEKLTLV